MNAFSGNILHKSKKVVVVYFEYSNCNILIIFTNICVDISIKKF